MLRDHAHDYAGSGQKAWAILLAAGCGSRMAQACGTAKQFLLWRGAPLYWHSAVALSESSCVEGIVFVFPEEFCRNEEERLKNLSAHSGLGVPWLVAAGGRRRQDSVRLGLLATPVSCHKIIVHDAARPFLKPVLVRRVFEALDAEHCSIVPALPVTDTVKLVSANDAATVAKTLPRHRLRAVQTPQAFCAAILRTAHERALRENLTVTDDAELMEASGVHSSVVPGDPANIKITNPEDMRLLVENERGFVRQCSGFGYDAHRFGPGGRQLRLGGIAIPGGFEVIAHSDGDVLLHALMDAILGCASLGDIGMFFPDSDPELAGVSSAVILDQTLEMARNAGVELCHVDMIVVAQKPRLAPFRDEIRNNVARLLRLPGDCVNFKATTEEGMGFTGAMEGIKAYAIVAAQRH